MKRIKCLLIVFCVAAVLPALAGKGPKVRIGMCTDVHLNVVPDGKERLTRFIDSMKVAGPDFIIELGDFVSFDRQYTPLMELWNSFPGEKYHVLGNHDLDNSGSLVEVLKFRGMEAPYYSFDKNGFHFIVLNGNDRSPNTKGYPRYVGSQQVSWLEKDLASAVLPVIIFSHQGLFEYSADSDPIGVENQQQVRKILADHNGKSTKSRVIACFNGHSHYDWAGQIDGIWFITITSMAYHWLGDQYAFQRFSPETEQKFPYVRFTAPFRDPLFTVVEITGKGKIRIGGKSSEWISPSPFDIGYPEKFRPYMRPAISPRTLKFKMKK